MSKPTTPSSFVLQSADIPPDSVIDRRHVFDSFGCTGDNQSPALAWRGSPAGTRSFAVTVYDPDAPTGSGWWHWLVYNIPADVQSLPRNAGNRKSGLAPAGSATGMTDYLQLEYGGPCPPPGPPHRYLFTVFALSVERLELPANATGAYVGFNLNANALAKASFTARFGR